jgi:hypothetical protein
MTRLPLEGEKGSGSFLDEGAGDAIDAIIKCRADREFQLVE